MKLLLIGSTVDDGSTSITLGFREVLKPDRFIEISQPLKTTGLKGLFQWWLALRQAGREATHVVCIQHSAIMLAGLFLPKRHLSSLTCMTDWSPAFPSRRKERKTKFHMFLYMRLLGKFDRVFAPPDDLREYFLTKYSFRAEPLLLPPPYGDAAFAPLCEDGQEVKLLLIGADFKRKGGEILLRRWEENRPENATLTLVTGALPQPLPKGVSHVTDLRARTERHRQLLQDHHLFVLASYRESYGYAALEALNMGEVVAVTRVAGIAGLIEQSGGIVEDTPEQVVEAALELARNPELLRKRQQRIREFVANYRMEFRAQLERMISAD